MRHSHLLIFWQMDCMSFSRMNSKHHCLISSSHSSFTLKWWIQSRRTISSSWSISFSSSLLDQSLMSLRVNVLLFLYSTDNLSLIFNNNNNNVILFVHNNTEFYFSIQKKLFFHFFLHLYSCLFGFYWNLLRKKYRNYEGRFWKEKILLWKPQKKKMNLKMEGRSHNYIFILNNIN